jgi:hypothetical protein
MKTRPPPDFFSLEDYAFVRELKDARDWLDALCCATAKLDPNWRDKQQEWRDIVGPEIENLHPGYIPPPVVQLIEEPLTLHPIELPALHLLISLNTPDGVIKEQFEAALRAARKKHPSPTKRRGPQRLNAQFGEQQFSTWRRYKILPLADLLAWCERQAEKISDAQIGRWLGFNEHRATRDVAQAREALRRALDSIPALAAQVAAEHSGAEVPGGRPNVPENSP